MDTPALPGHNCSAEEVRVESVEWMIVIVYLIDKAKWLWHVTYTATQLSETWHCTARFMDNCGGIAYKYLNLVKWVSTMYEMMLSLF